MADIIQMRGDTEANWIAYNPVLSARELAFTTDSVPVTMKIGNGVSSWNELDYFSGLAGKSAYQIWIDNGNFGTEQQFLLSLNGATGETGLTGETGGIGLTGNAATISVGTVTTGIPGSAVQVINSGTSSAAILDISIPQGATGTSGSGTGDMLKATYDTGSTTNTNKVDVARAADTIGNITVVDTSIPTTYTSDVTTLLSGVYGMLKQITGKNDAMTVPVAALSTFSLIRIPSVIPVDIPNAGISSKLVWTVTNAYLGSASFFIKGTPSVMTKAFLFLYKNSSSLTLTAAITTTTATSITTSKTLDYSILPMYIMVDSEIIQVTAVSGTTSTIVRGQIGTSATTHITGSNILQTIGDPISISTAGINNSTSLTPVMSKLLNAITATDTTVTISSPLSYNFSSCPFFARIDSEIMYVTAMQGSILTVVRGQNGTIATGHGTTMYLKGALQGGLYDYIVPVFDAGGLSSCNVSLTTQWPIIPF